MNTLDVLVVGAGPAGAIAARLLAQAGYRTGLMDDIRQTEKVGESLAGAARPLLRDLGLLEWMDDSGAKPCMGNLSAWGSEELVATDFIRDPHGMGWHLNRVCFDTGLREAALAEGVQWYASKLQAVIAETEQWRIPLSMQDIKTRWIIDASGRRSVCAKRLGCKRLKDAPLIAVYAWGENNDQDERTLIEAVPYGWWYTAPLPEGRRVVSLHVEAKEAASFMRHPGLWHEYMAGTHHIRQLCSTQHWSSLRAAEAGSSRLAQAAGNRWLAIGDAALAFDPLSSQGMFNALYTGLRGAQAVANALEGNIGMVEQYCARLEQIHLAYQQHVHYYYQAEQRWAQASFWRSRLLAHSPQ
ncbi:MAG: FAD-dependent monooxygenase [Pseudomonadota bacterium]